MTKYWDSFVRLSLQVNHFPPKVQGNKSHCIEVLYYLMMWPLGVAWSPMTQALLNLTNLSFTVLKEIQP